MGWKLIDYGDGVTHIMPVDEMDQHRQSLCRCRPKVDQESDAVVHNSFDGREDFESGKRKPS